MSVTREMRAQVANIVGPGYGEIICLVADRDDAYGDLLRRRGVTAGSIFTDLAEAEDAMTANRNDCLLVYPGDHAVTASITWDKSVTNIIGVGSKNQRFQPSTLTTGGVRLSCTTAAVAEILLITGDYVSMYGVGTFNSAASTSNKSDINISGRNFYAELCAFRGGNSSTQTANATAGIPIWVDSATAGGGNAMWIKNCHIGSPGNADRTKGPGCIYFEGGAAAGFNPVIENCILSSRHSASTNQSCLVLLEANYAVDRELLFKSCNFYNFVENLASLMDYAIQDECATTHMITLDPGCTMTGIDAWCNVGTYCFTTQTNATSDGGKGIAVDTTP
uniref:Pectate lyase n=1 Tax=viral metagenome TaxID=1070528 RepID=A0A6M3LHW1_9ZZZZ